MSKKKLPGGLTPQRPPRDTQKKALKPQEPPKPNPSRPTDKK